MADKNTDILDKLDKETVDRFLRLNKENQEKEEAYLDKLISHTVSDSNLVKLDKGLKRSEQKLFKKKKIKLSDYVFGEEDQDKYLDAFLEIKQVSDKEADNFDFGELVLVMERVFLRTRDPLKFEGK